MRRFGSAPAVAVCGVLVLCWWTAAASARTYEYARAVGKRCSTCHTSKHPNITNLNDRGRYYLTHRTLDGYTPPATDSRGRPAAQKFASRGEQIFTQTCALCHGSRGEGTPRGKPLVGPGRKYTTAAQIAEVVRHGIKGTAMASFARAYSDADIVKVARYAASLAR